MKKLFKNTSFLSVFLSVCILLFLYSFSFGFSSLNKNIQNHFYAFKNTISPPLVNKDILIVGIDDTSFQNLGQFPFARSLYAQAIEKLSLYNPAVIAFDLLLLDKTTEIEDGELEKALQNQDRIVVGASIDKNNTLHIPEARFYETGVSYGFLAPEVNDSNKTVYSFRPERKVGNTSIEHFAIQTLRQYYAHIFEEEIQNTGRLFQTGYEFSPERFYPYSRPHSQEILIRFIDEKNFSYISFSDVLDPEFLESFQKEFNLQDSIILVGPTAVGLKDTFFTPNGNEYGVYIHANILNTLLTKQHLIYFHRVLEWMLIFCIIILSTLVNFSSKRQVLIYGNIIIFFLFGLLLPLGILVTTSMVFNFPFEILSSFIMSFGLTHLVKYLIEDNNKIKLGKALSEYVNLNVMEEVLHEQGKVYLDGEKKELCVFFSDIEGFTNISEKLNPEEVVAFLRQYFGAMSYFLTEQGAYIDKFEGDAIMALWGAFDTLQQKDFDKICELALLQQKYIAIFSKKWVKTIGSHIRIRIGLHVGEAIVGNIGAPGIKMNFTALGDSVNLASRLESINKYYGVYVCVSDDFQKQVSEVFVFRKLDSVRVKGRDTPLDIYELIGKKSEISESMAYILKNYNLALEKYQSGDFKNAYTVFCELYKKGDAPSGVLKKRIEDYNFISPKNWDGIWNMQEK